MAMPHNCHGPTPHTQVPKTLASSTLFYISSSDQKLERDGWTDGWGDPMNVTPPDLVSPGYGPVYACTTLS
jgi:hypothetical protein